MKIYIANFANLRNMNENCIPVSTAVWQPKFWKYGIDKHNIFLGLSERELSPYKIDIEDEVLCCKDCPRKKDLPDCEFLRRYRAYLDTVDMNYILSEFSRVSEEVRMITHYEGDPSIVLLVYEAEDNPCSERKPLIEWFAKHGIAVENWRKSV